MADWTAHVTEFILLEADYITVIFTTSLLKLPETADDGVTICGNDICGSLSVTVQ